MLCRERSVVGVTWFYAVGFPNNQSQIYSARNHYKTGVYKNLSANFEKKHLQRPIRR